MGTELRTCTRERFAGVVQQNPRCTDMRSVQEEGKRRGAGIEVEAEMGRVLSLTFFGGLPNYDDVSAARSVPMLLRDGKR